MLSVLVRTYAPFYSPMHPIDITFRDETTLLPTSHFYIIPTFAPRTPYHPWLTDLAPKKSTWTGHPHAPLTTQINDPLTIPTLLDHLEASLCIRTSRIHAYGFSAGGALVDLLACTPQISRRIASFAATSPSVYVDAALQEPLFSTCPSGGRAMPMLWFFGTADPVVDFEGKGSKAGETWPVERRMKGWAGRNGCAVDQVVKEDVYEGKVERWSWSSGLYGDDVVQLYLVKGWGHGVGATWPLENDVSPCLCYILFLICWVFGMFLLVDYEDGADGVYSMNVSDLRPSMRRRSSWTSSGVGLRVRGGRLSRREGWLMMSSDRKQCSA